MRENRGLTLVEVLTVAAVLAVLIALALPVLKIGRDSGRSLLCASNLKQIGLYTEAYEQDHQCFPQGFSCQPECFQTAPPQGFAGKPVYDRPGWWWFDFLGIEDRSSQGILWCPARRPMNEPLRENVLWCNYGMNYSVGKWASPAPEGEFQGTPLRKSQLSRPSAVMLYSDSGYGLVSWKAAAGIPNPFDNNPMRNDSFYLPGLKINRSRPIHPEQQADAWNGRHLGSKISVAYADGHISPEKAEELLVQTDAAGNLCPSASYFWTAGR